MKKNLALRLGTLALVLTFITASLVSGTFAKYVKEVTGTDTVRVAKFAFNLTDGTDKIADETATSTIALDVFSMATDTGVYGNGINGSDNFIAPGTSGDFTLEVENLSEVDVAVTFTLGETNTSNIPVYYTLGADAQRYSDVLTGTYNTTETYMTLADLTTAMAGTSLQASDGTTATTATYTLNWAWAFDSAGTGQSDSDDTTLGVAYSAAPEILLSVATTVTQVN